MESSRTLNRSIRYVVVITALLLAVIIPAVASAAQLTQRSIALSSSSANADNVTYQVNFTTSAAGGAVVLDFCSNSPIVGQTCDAPVGFDVTDAAATGYTVNVLEDNTLALTGTIASGDVSITVTGIDNPTEPGPLYARIITYSSAAAANAQDYTSTALGSGSVDNGGAAISIQRTVGVSAAVQESLFFCVSKEAIGINCDEETIEAPTVKLGNQVGTTETYILNPGEVHTGEIFTQISTNAADGAVISLKSSATNCGGLLRSSDPTACDILPALTNGVDATTARFGVRAETVADTANSGALGVLQPYDGSGYNASTYVLNYADENATGVTSVYGDRFLDTDSAPANNKNMKLTFAVSSTNATPAGSYSADLSLIATGKF